MASRAITDLQISASSQYQAAIHGRLHFQNSWKRGAWSAGKNDDKQWLQIDLIGQYTVTGVFRAENLCAVQLHVHFV